MRIKMLAFRQGYFHPEPLHGGREYDLQDSTAKYLVDLGVAVLVGTGEQRSTPAAPASHVASVPSVEANKPGVGSVANTGVGRSGSLPVESTETDLVDPKRQKAK